MSTNKDKLKALMHQHFHNMKKDINNCIGTQIRNDSWHLSKAIEDYELVLINTYFSSIDWASEYEVKDLAWIRPDIIEKNLAVPVGSGYYGGKDPLPYRWLGNDEVFEVLYGGVWVEAQSIDWDFTDALVQDVVKSIDDMAFLDGSKEDA